MGSLLVWKGIGEVYAADRVIVQYTNLDLSSWCNPTTPKKFYPKLKGKGAEVRDLVMPLCKVWARHQDGTAHHRRVLRVLELQCYLQSILH